MQAPRNWRTKIERYTLTGNTSANGDASVVNRPQSLSEKAESTEEQATVITSNAA